MYSQNGTKINQLLKKWPKGTLAVLSWMKNQGISRQLANTYCQSHWLSRIDNGVYKQSSDSVDWTGALYTLQKELGLKIHAGAKTSLEMMGMSHYLPLGGISTLLFVSPNTKKIPRWFKRHFNDDIILFFPKALFTEWDIGLQEKDLGNYSILISSPERAIIECLYLVPQKLSLEHATELMEKLRTLRPQLIQTLLENCCSIKVKRVFLYLAETQQHPWFVRIDTSKIDLGKGKRVIGKGGKYVAKYRISLPEINRHEGFYEDDNQF
jgi:hypothetical protein